MCPAMAPVGHSPRLKAPTGGELLTIQHAVVSDRERGLTEVSCNGACGPLTKTEGTYRGRVADNSADVSEKEDLLMCPAMAPVGHSPRLKAPTGGELLTIQQMLVRKRTY